MPRASLRTKLLLASLPLLALPWLGVQYVREVESLLRQDLRTSVLDAATTLAAVVQADPERLVPLRTATAAPGAHLRAHRISHALTVDGYPQDWEPLLDGATAVALVPGAGPTRATALAATDGTSFYLLLRVRDPTAVYPPAETGRETQGDHVIVSAMDERGRGTAFVLSTPSPGWVNVGAQTLRRGEPIDGPARPEVRGRAAWQPWAEGGGYHVELRLPLALAGPRLSVVVHDGTTAGVEARPGPTTLADDGQAALPLLLPDPGLDTLLRARDPGTGRELWLADAHGRVLARAGNLGPAAPRGRSGLDWLFALPSPEPLENGPLVDALGGEEVARARRGEAASAWRQLDDGPAVLVSAAHPVRDGERVVGVAVVHHSAAAIQTLRNRAVGGLLLATVAAFAVAGIWLVAFGSRVALRLTRLRDDADRAIDESGRVVGVVRGAGRGDEIAELAGVLGSLLERLRGYHEYLEALRRRLGHELRTPVAVVRSSLESLDPDADAARAAPYLARARDGVARLDAILRRLGEATRLEEALADAELEGVDLGALLARVVEGYRLAWPATAMHLELPTDDVLRIRGAPDLLAQMLDKLVSNARDFAHPGTAIRLRAWRAGDRVMLAVENEGPRLPPEMREKVFDAMVSARAEGRSDEPHLGLGLHVVRLVATHHGARAVAEDLDRGEGVRIRVDLPAG
ncbi:MAG: hypothetical protein H6983_13595 [Ectothiorhodospiraceae bacterium]|nr:hypothetical protein [Ectothiorhodospiraceae bacterium]